MAEKRPTIHRTLSTFDIFALPFHKQANGLELTCGGMHAWYGSASARPLLIYSWCCCLRAAKPTRKCFRQVERIVRALCWYESL